MKKMIFFLSIICVVGVLFFSVFTPPVEVNAEAVGDQLAAKGCWRTGTSYGGGNFIFSCRYSPRGGGVSTIEIPFPRVRVNPNNGLVNIPVLFAVDWAPDSVGYSPYSVKYLEVAERARYTDFRSELLVRVFVEDDKVLNVSSSSSWFPLEQDIDGAQWRNLAQTSNLEWKDEMMYGLLGREQLRDAKVALGLDDVFIPPSDTYDMGGFTDAVYYISRPLRSSKSAAGASYYDGYKGFPITVSAKWDVYSRVSWSSYQEYEWVSDWQCTSPTPVAPSLPLSTPLAPVCRDYGKDEWVTKSGVGGTGGFVKVLSESLTTNDLYDARRDGYYADFAYPVFQSQPLLQDH